MSVSVPQLTVRVLLDPNVIAASSKQRSGLDIIWCELRSGHDAVQSQTESFLFHKHLWSGLNRCGQCHDSGG